jgi:BirA family transcriptional regulator, biotin operon repressor / biotin---[acetyl-CoA-carboxylase] ligase
MDQIAKRPAQGSRSRRKATSSGFQLVQEGKVSSADRFTGPPGWTVHYLPETGSTNDLAKAAGKRGAPGRSVFVTDHQTAGRGRMERKWLETPGSSLLFSILFRGPLAESTLITMLCSVAASEAIEETAGMPVDIKWPNDLMLSGRKLAGLLTEVNWYPDNHFAVVGMGINVNLDPQSLPGVPDTATSLLRETGQEHSRAPLLFAILSCLDRFLAMEGSELREEVRSRWVSRLWRRRQTVVIADGGQVLEGVFEDVDAEGILLLRLPDGTLHRVQAGDLLV